MRLPILLLCAALSFLPALTRAQGTAPGQGYDPQPQGYDPQRQVYGQPELDALIAPIALYPDDVVRLVLDASSAPDEVAEAAQWSRANRGMTGEDAVRAVQEYGWLPSVKALAAYPDLLERMAESPQWMFDLGNAWIAQQAAVLSTVQALRQRAYASGTLRSDGYQTVQASGNAIAVVPAQPYIYYVPYYDPLVVYGGWWWPAYRPVHWRPWRPSPVFVTNVVVVNRGFHGRGAFAHRGNVPHAVSPAVRFQAQSNASFAARQRAANRPAAAAQLQSRVPAQSFHAPAFRRVPESQRQPIVQSRGQAIVQRPVAPASPQHQTQRPAFTAPHQHSAPASSGGGSSPSRQHHRGRS